MAVGRFFFILVLDDDPNVKSMVLYILTFACVLQVHKLIQYQISH